MVPLYFAMLLAYGSVKWWKIFSPEQCSGINRFVAVFAVPVLSFHFISQNNPYEMDIKFILADTLSKAFVLFLLSFWCICKGELDWLITLFSVSSLPNTLVMGIPLLNAMYGEFTESLMVQLVVLQCIIWYVTNLTLSTNRSIYVEIFYIYLFAPYVKILARSLYTYIYIYLRLYLFKSHTHCDFCWKHAAK